ncbi:hypothetical protein [uncultured Treponema sp.]|uniref:hypothetical protein n=1 Tax=uncultured Treponema sp. TaxID=162155 RepID=UPI0028EC681D|nr:hypothetical protein [uncultured Treponema sp.]
MYFSKKRIISLTQILATHGSLPVHITCDIGWCDPLELKDTVDILFHAWNIFWKKQYYSRYLAFRGILRRLCITYDAKKECCKPYISLLVLLPTGDTDIRNIEHRLYIAWITALGQHTDAAVSVAVIEKEAMEETVRVFCTVDTIEQNDEPTRVDRTVQETIKTIKERHRFFAFGGLFKNV